MFREKVIAEETTVLGFLGVEDCHATQERDAHLQAFYLLTG